MNSFKKSKLTLLILAVIMIVAAALFLATFQRPPKTSPFFASRWSPDITAVLNAALKSHPVHPGTFVAFSLADLQDATPYDTLGNYTLDYNGKTIPDVIEVQGTIKSMATEVHLDGSSIWYTAIEIENGEHIGIVHLGPQETAEKFQNLHVGENVIVRGGLMGFHDCAEIDPVFQQPNFQGRVDTDCSLFGITEDMCQILMLGHHHITQVIANTVGLVGSFLWSRRGVMMAQRAGWQAEP